MKAPYIIRPVINPSAGFVITDTEQPVSIADAVDTALAILSFANSCAGWRPNHEQRQLMAAVLLAERQQGLQREVMRQYDAGQIGRAEAERLGREAAARLAA